MALTFFRATAHAEPPSAELAAALGKWQAAISKLARYEITGHRIVYERAFETQRQADFIIRYNGPDAIQIETRPAEFQQGQQSGKRNRAGKPYRLESETASLWTWTEKELVFGFPGTGKIIHDWPADADNIQPPDYLSPLAFPENHMPALFAADAPKFRDEYDWEIYRKMPTAIWVRGEPTSPAGKQMLSELSVILDRETGRPRAQRTIDPSGNLEVVHTFKDWNFTPQASAVEFDPQHWDLEHFTYSPDFKPLSHRRKK
jgi:hypothetical protein